MNEADFEGTLVLEQLARIDVLDEFMSAVDVQDVGRAEYLMCEAGIDSATIAIVMSKIVDPWDEA